MLFSYFSQSDRFKCYKLSELLDSPGQAGGYTDSPWNRFLREQIILCQPMRILMIHKRHLGAYLYYKEHQAIYDNPFYWLKISNKK